MKCYHLLQAVLFPLIVASTASTGFGQLGSLSTSIKSPFNWPHTPVYSHDPLRLPDFGINGPRISIPNYPYTPPSVKKIRKGGIEIGTTTKTITIPKQNTLHSGTLSDDPRVNRDLIKQMQAGNAGAGKVSFNPPKVIGKGPDPGLQAFIESARRQKEFEFHHNMQMIQQSAATLGNLIRPNMSPNRPPDWLQGPRGGWNSGGFNPVQEINRGQQELQKGLQHPIVQHVTNPTTYDPGRYINVSPSVIPKPQTLDQIPMPSTADLINGGAKLFNKVDDTLVDLGSQRLRARDDLAADGVELFKHADDVLVDFDQQRLGAQDDLFTDADDVLVDLDQQRLRAQDDLAADGIELFKHADDVLVDFDQQRLRAQDDLAADGVELFNRVDEVLVDFDKQRVRAQNDLVDDTGNFFAGLEKNGRRAAEDFVGTRMVGAFGNSISKHVTARAIRESTMGAVDFFFDPLGEIAKNAPGARAGADYERLAGEENEKRLRYGSIRAEAEILNEEGVAEETIQFIKRNNDGKWSENDKRLFRTRFEERFEEEFVRWLDAHPNAELMSDDEFDREIELLQEAAQQKALADVYEQYGLDSDGNALDRNGEPIIIARVTEPVLVKQDVFEPGYSGPVSYTDSEGNLQVDPEAVVASRGEVRTVRQWKMVTRYRRLEPEEIEQAKSEDGFSANLTESQDDKDYDDAFDPDYQYPDPGDDGPLPDYPPEPIRNDPPSSTQGSSSAKPRRPDDRGGFEYDRDDYTTDRSPGSRPGVSKEIKIVRNVKKSTGRVPKGTGLAKSDLRRIAARMMERNRRRQSKGAGPQTSGVLDDNVVVRGPDSVQPWNGNGAASPVGNGQAGIYQYANDPNLNPNNFIPFQQFQPLPLNPAQSWNPFAPDRSGLRDGDPIVEFNPHFIDDEYQDYETGQYIPRNSQGVGVGIALGRDRPEPYRVPHNTVPTPTGDSRRTSEEFNSTFDIENKAAQKVAEHLIPNETKKGLTAVAKLPETLSSIFETRAEQKRREEEQQARQAEQDRQAKVKELFGQNLKERQARGNYEVIPEQYIERYIDRPWYDRLMTLDSFYERERKNDEAAAVAKAASEQKSRQRILDEQQRMRQQQEQQRLQDNRRRYDRWQEKLSNSNGKARFESAKRQWEDSRKGQKWLRENPRPADPDEQMTWELERRTEVYTELWEAEIERDWERSRVGREWLEQNPEPADPTEHDKWKRSKRNQSNTWNLFRPETSVSEGGIRAELSNGW